MAGKGSLSFVELHLEKIVLGVAVAFTLGVGVYVLLGPNQVEYQGQNLGPRDLNREILARAERLRRADETARPKTEPVPRYAERLEGQFQRPIFQAGANAPALAAESLTPVATFNLGPPPIEDDQAESKAVAVVTPLRPTTPVVRTGRSVVRVRQAQLAGTGTATAAGGASEKQDEPKEMSWATVAVYFDKNAERDEMAKAGYAPYRAKVYIVGTDVQRQELLPSGEFGKWEDVMPSQAMPRIDIPTPIIDKRTGDVANQAALDEALELVRQNQNEISQPDFYDYEAGDEWEMPALAGHEPAEEEDESTAVTPPAKTPKEPKEPKQPKQPQTPPVGPGKGGVVGPGGYPPGPGGYPPGPGGYPPGPGGYPPGPGGYRPPLPGGGYTGQNPAAVKREIDKNLKEARTALKKKDYSLAEQFAQSVVNNPQASKVQKTQAQRVIDQVAQARKKEAGAGGSSSGGAVRPTSPGPVYPPGPYGPYGPRPPYGPQAGAGGPSATGGPVADPKTGAVAVWFHDDSVEPGKTYRYRMRVKLWNRYVGRLASLADPEQAQQTVLIGEWSLPGDPITIAPKLHFFVRSQKWNEPAAQVDVFAWHKGKWLREPFDVRVGEVIGAVKEIKVGEDEDGKALRESVDFTTHAIVMDIRPEEPVLTRTSAGKAGEFRYSEGRSLVLTYLDPADGQIKERSLNGDKANPLYEKLKRRAQGVPRRVP